jgi:hypothetical protein
MSSLRVPAALLALLGLLLVSAPALATKVGWHTSPCPLDGTQSKVYELYSQNSHGGYDSDLCSYSSQGQWRAYAIATCPEDLLTLYAADFDKVLDEQDLLAVRAEVDELSAEHPDADALEVWDRYALAVRFYEAMGRDDAFLGELYHQASWVARDGVVGVFLGLEGPMAAKELLVQGELELVKDLPAADRIKLLHNLARIAHRYGDSALRDRYLAQLEAVPGVDQGTLDTVATMRHLALEVEPRFQDLAIERYLAWLRLPDLERDRLLRVTYLVADLLRRRGRLVEAVPLYSLVATSEDAPQQLRELALFLASEIVDEAKAQDAAQR